MTEFYFTDWSLDVYETLQIMDREYIENLAASLVREYLSRKVSLLAITHPKVQVTSSDKLIINDCLTTR